MRFKLAAKGTVTECREKLNAALSELQPPFKQEHAVIRNIAHFIVEENLDPLYLPWVAACQMLRAGNAAPQTYPAEPKTAFSIDCTIEVEELARQ
ncbi:MAG TPA: hypothetical protein VGD02_08950 [Gemmatimonadaceae bacterium]|jgi:hypothetical protein